MIWTIEAVGELARHGCELCGGTGAAPSTDDCGIVPCVCACRRVFAICYRRFRQCSQAEGFSRSVSFVESRKGVDRHLMWIRRNEDYCADFQAAGRRVLSAELNRVFRFYHLLGGGADLVARRLRLSRAHFFRLVEEVETKVGLELALMQPYSPFPPRQYMSRTVLSRAV